MNSMNLKRVAALVAGAAMIGSVITSGLAVTQTLPDLNAVRDLITSATDNLDNTLIVLGSAADISDGVAAAKLAAVLASKYDYQATTTGGDVQGIDGLGVSYTGAPSVTVTTTGEQVTVEPDHYDIEYTLSQAITPNALAPRINGGYSSATRATSSIITPVVLGDILTEGAVEAYIGNRRYEYIYREQIMVDHIASVRYFEGHSPDGHGLYLYAPHAGAGVLHYQVDFRISGNGLPTNATYQKIPLMIMLGTEYAIDTIDLALTNPKLTLYSGVEVTLVSGESYETENGYTMTLSSVGLATNNVVEAHVVCTDPDGNTQTTAIQQLQGWDFFSNQASIYIETACTACYIEENVATGMITSRIGAGKLYLQGSAEFPLDDRWTVQAINYTGNIAGINYLQVVDLKYGNPIKATAIEKGEFLATELAGLKEGVVIDGPHNQEGTALYNMQLAGFGGVTKIDSTEIIVEALGSNAGGDDVLQVTWTGVDGKTQEFKPVMKTQVNLANLNTPDAGTSLFEANLSTTVPWTIINNYSVYFAGIQADPSVNQYAAEFYIGGYPNGVKVRTTYNWSPEGTNSSNVILSYIDITGELRCNVNMTNLSTVQVNVTSQWAAIANPWCDTWPDNVTIGYGPVMDLGRPWMNMTNVTDGNTYANAGVAALMMLPLLKIHEINGYMGMTAVNSSLGIIYDSCILQAYDASADPTTGIVVFNTTGTADNGIPAADFNLTAGAAGVVNTSRTLIYEEDKYWVSPTGTRVSSDGANKLTIELPEGSATFPRNTIFRIAETIQEVEGGGVSTVDEGDTVDSVTITTINCPTGSVSGVDNLSCGAAGTYYTSRNLLNYDSPATLLVVMDNAVPAGAQYKFVIGGPWVNSIAAGMDYPADIEGEIGVSYLYAEGNNLLVAGRFATDTTEAVNKLITDFLA